VIFPVVGSRLAVPSRSMTGLLGNAAQRDTPLLCTATSKTVRRIAGTRIAANPASVFRRSGRQATHSRASFSTISRVSNPGFFFRRALSGRSARRRPIIATINNVVFIGGDRCAGCLLAGESPVTGGFTRYQCAAADMHHARAETERAKLVEKGLADAVPRAEQRNGVSVGDGTVLAILGRLREHWEQLHGEPVELQLAH
jgi:hypothetical protein